MDRQAHVLIAAASGRALAASARRGGYRPLVADFFGDQDTLTATDAHYRLADGLVHGMRHDELMSALDILSYGRAPVGVVCGTGFEDRPDLLGAIAQRWTLIGNRADVVARIKHPMEFADLCRAGGIAHPEVSLTRPADPEAWLVKRCGGAGGHHVAQLAEGIEAGRYFQRRVPGTPVSAMFLADGRRAAVLGFSAQWASPAPAKPYRFGGAVAPADISPTIAAVLGDVIGRITAAVPLVGLNSADFLVHGDDAWLLEINPRPGATLDIFEPEGGSLFSLHVKACRGELVSALAAHEGARASAIIYADRDIPVPAFDWPDWTADRPHAGGTVNAGEPLCTVLAAAATSDDAKRLVTRRTATILCCMRARAA
jgi:predicted ATP-grasp superfamily ATP-dependent carboligase